MYMDGSFELIREFDPEIAQMTVEEETRQMNTLCLIASENYASPMTLGMEGTVWANKNAEGYPGRRFAGGCELADRVERLAVKRCKELFGCEYANVQSMSSTLSNVAVLRALLKPGDMILSMELNQGGHLSHGAKFHYSGKSYQVIQYGLNPKTEVIDMEQVERLAKEHRPKLIICGTSSYPLKVDYKRFGEIAREVGAYLMADIAHPVGLIAAGVIPSPIPYADVVTTTTHKTLRGPRGGMILANQEAAEKFNFNKAVFPGIQGGPLEHVIAAKAVCFGEALKPEFKVYQQQIVNNAQALAKSLMAHGFDLVSGGTDNHLMLVDLRKSGVTGKELEKRLDEVYITVNKNAIPNDPQSPFITSGIRIGTPAVTSRGLVESDMEKIGELIALAASPEFEAKKDYIRGEVSQICEAYPLY